MMLSYSISNRVHLWLTTHNVTVITIEMTQTKSSYQQMHVSKYLVTQAQLLYSIS